MIRALTFPFVALAVACAAPEPKILGQGCGCGTYMTTTPRPAWVDAGDRVTASMVSSQGSAQCTGLKQMDLDAADLSARSKLSRIINVTTDIALTETRTDTGFGAGRARARIEAVEISRVVLEGSRIGAHWVDPESCRIYERADLPRSEMEKTKARLESEEKARLVNQAFVISAQGPHADALRVRFAEALSAASVKRVVTSSTPDSYRAVIRLDTIERVGNGLTARLGLAFIAPNGDTVWSRTVPARAASYDRKSDQALIDRAIGEALHDIAPTLRTVLEK